MSETPTDAQLEDLLRLTRLAPSIPLAGAETRLVDSVPELVREIRRLRALLMGGM